MCHLSNLFSINIGILQEIFDLPANFTYKYVFYKKIYK